MIEITHMVSMMAPRKTTTPSCCLWITVTLSVAYRVV